MYVDIYNAYFQARLLTQDDVIIKLSIADMLEQYWEIKTELRTGIEIGNR